MVKLSIIIVNYNVRYFLEQALLSVLQATKNINAEVFVVDNHSMDDSVRMVEEKFPDVILIANKENYGFAKANNQAIEQAKGAYILLLNPDTVIEENTLEKCLGFMDGHAKAGGLGVKMIDGAGNFLPESKRGLPTPLVAFSKAFGLSKLFPKSKTFNHYHLGYLDKDQTHEVEVLAGAFMLLRKSVLDEIGWLDETFFMYGEDIDLSYRIIKAGYKNYYFADTTIIHYKGESTKKGSLNYVRTFYRAMIIFSKKHFSGDQAKVMTGLLQLAIYFRAFLTLISNFFKRIYLPILDALFIFVGMYWLKDFWAAAWFDTPDYYHPSFVYLNIPLYISVWLLSVYLKGGYDKPYSIRALFTGLAVGSVLLAAIYGLLPLTYRTSRMLLLLGAVWAFISTFLLRFVLHFLKFKHFKIGQTTTRNLILVGSKTENERVLRLLQQAKVSPNYIGMIAPQITDDVAFLSDVHQLNEVVQIYQIGEIIFCSKDIPAQTIMHWMTRLGPAIHYKILPTESMSIIGSHSKNTSGELYTIDIQYNITMPLHRRNKRLLDVFVAIGLGVLFPIFIFINNNLTLKQVVQVLIGKKSWIGYAHPKKEPFNLPRIKDGIFSTITGIHNPLNNRTIQRLNYLYARDYDWRKDSTLIWNGIKSSF